LADNRNEKESGQRAARPSLLAGLIYDQQGRRLTPTHAVNKGRRYRYYISRALLTGGATKSDEGNNLRLPAHDLEQIVTDRLRSFLGDQSTVFAAIQASVENGIAQRNLLHKAQQIASDWQSKSLSERRAMLCQLGLTVTVQRQQFELQVQPHLLLRLLAGEDANEPNAPPPSDATPIALSSPMTLRRAGPEMRLLIGGTTERPEPNPRLIRLIVKAQQLKDQLLNDNVGVAELAEREGVIGPYITRVLRLAFLAPDIITAILEGRQPAELTAGKLLLDTRLPLAWSEQRRLLGFN
jgi:site-specific DNA recombinase